MLRGRGGCGCGARGVWLWGQGHATLSRNRIERDQGHQIEQDYADLVGSKACVMNRIKSFDRELKPTAVDSEHPVMSKDKDAEPDE